MTKWGATLLAMLPLAAVGFPVWTASAAGTYYEGGMVSNALPLEESPVVVEEEHIVISVPGFPKLPDASVPYSASVTTELTLSNPTEEDITLDLVLPLGRAADYLPQDLPDTAAYRVQADGETLPTKLRYSYRKAGAFSPEEEAKQLTGEGTQDPFYREDLPVTVYSFHVSAPSSTGKLYFILKFDCSPRETRVICSEPCNMFVEDGRGKIAIPFSGELSFKVYVLGQDPVWVEKRAFVLEEGGLRAVSASLTEDRIQTALAEFSDSIRPQGEISREDWYHAVLTWLTEGTKGSYMCCLGEGPAASLFPWLEYSLTIPAGGRTVNTVSMPIYPTLRISEEQSVGFYSLLLSPAQCWAEFGSLSITIETDLSLSESSLAFEKTEDGFLFRRDRLPQGELRFSLTEGERIYSPPPYENGLPSDNNIIYLYLAGVVVGTGILVTVLVLLLRRKKRIQHGETQEGKVDLPDDEGKQK